MNDTPTNAKPSGLELIHLELARQHGDALASLHGNQVVANSIAQSLQTTQRLVLLGMGGSHFANRSAEGEYRRLGLDTNAIALSEVLYNPLPTTPHTVILASQSGESGEVVRYLQTPSSETRFGLTLNPQSTLARSLPSLIGTGGIEQGFAATRSLMVSVTLHAAVLQALGQAQGDLEAILQNPPKLEVEAALAALADCETVMFVARDSLQGIAEMAALGLTELGRIPALAYEGGQFRHGPLEMLAPKYGVVFLRAAGATAEHTKELAEICLAARMTPVVFDLSGEAPVAGCVTLEFPKLSGLAAAAAVLYPLQALLLGLAAQRVERVGEPVRSSKITRQG